MGLDRPLGVLPLLPVTCTHVLQPSEEPARPGLCATSFLSALPGSRWVELPAISAEPGNQEPATLRCASAYIPLTTACWPLPPCRR